MTDRAVRSRSAASTNGSPLSPSWQRPASTTPRPPGPCRGTPPAAGSSRSPAAPSTATTRPAAPTSRQAGVQRVAHPSRPTSGQPAGPGAAPARGPGPAGSGASPAAGASGGRAGTGRHGRRGGRGQPPGPDVVVEPGGLRQRPHRQLGVEDPDQRPVLAQRGGPLPGPRQQPDQRLVRGLVQRVEGQPALRVRHRAVQVTGGGAGRDQPVQRTAASRWRSRSAVAACQSSNSGQSRSANPARKSSRYSRTARSSASASGARPPGPRSRPRPPGPGRVAAPPPPG